MKSTLLLLALSLIVYQAAGQTNCTNSTNTSILANCAVCANNTGCAECNPGYKDFEGVCLECGIQNCDFCKDADICTYCKTGYDLLNGKCIQCNVNRCDLCSSKNFCISCKNTSASKYYPTAEGDSCVICEIANCQKCTKNNSCGQCSNGYQLYPVADQQTAEDRVCVTCNLDNCMTCSKNDYCQICEIGYQNKNDGTCFPCNYPCASCNANATCKTCVQPDFFVNPGSDGQCFVSSVGQCLEYSSSNQTRCQKCKQFYDLNSTSNRCIFSCNQNCLTCDIVDKKKCLSCAEGEYLTLTNTCQPCSLGCLECTNGSVCTKAANRFYLSGTQAKRCLFSACKVCTSATDCTELTDSTGKVLFTSANGQVLKVRCASTCQTCSSKNPQICITCFDGYFNIDGLCFACNDICKTCDTTNASKCLSCFTGSFKLGDTCISCNSNCLTCQSAIEPNVCLTCSRGRFLDTVSKTCVSGSPSDCEISISATDCEKCSTGFTLFDSDHDSNLATPDRIVCLQCISTCRKCVRGQPENCLQCGDGLYLKGAECLSCSNNCKTCNSQGCIQCYSGSQLTESLTCSSKCISPCSSCSADNPRACSSCEAGYIFDSVTKICIDDISCNDSCSICPSKYALKTGTCLRCSTENCAKCNPANISDCVSCVEGYYLQSGSCRPCKQGCTTCLSAEACTQCSNKFFSGMKKGKGFPCESCTGKCETCINQANTCKTCKEGSILVGRKCKNTFIFNFFFNLGLPLKNFRKNSLSFLIIIAVAMGAQDSNAATFTSITEGSINIAGSGQPSGQPGSTEAGKQLRSFNAIISSGSIAGMPITSSSLTVAGGGVTAPAGSSSNLGLILGICIPLGVLIFIGIVLFIVYANKRVVGSKIDDIQNQRDYDNKGQSSVKDVLYQQNSFV